MQNKLFVFTHKVTSNNNNIPDEVRLFSEVVFKTD